MGTIPFHVNVDLGDYDLLQPIGFDKWRKGDTPDEIEGVWAEDFSNYKMIVPYQLRDSIIMLQNILCDRINELQKAKFEYQKAGEKLEKFLDG